MNIRKIAVKEKSPETVKAIDRAISFIKLKLQPPELPNEIFTKRSALLRYFLPEIFAYYKSSFHADNNVEPFQSCLKALIEIICKGDFQYE